MTRAHSAVPTATSDERAFSTRAFRIGLAAAAFMAFVARFSLVVVVRDRHEYGFDATWYSRVADHVADGDGYVIGALDFAGGFVAPFEQLEPTALFPPAFPAVLAVGSLVGLDTPVGHQIVASGLGAITVVLVGLLGRKVANARVGLLAALVAAVHPMLVGGDVAAMSESLYLVVVTAAILLAYRAAEHGDLASWLALGATLGIGVLTRSEGVVFAMLMIGAAVITTDPGRRSALRPVAAVIVVLLVATPWLVRNAVVLDAAGLATNVGATVAGANCTSTYETDRLGFWDVACLDFDRWAESGASEVEFFAMLRREGVEFARDHPDRWPAVVAARVGRLTGLYRPIQELDFASTEGRHRPVQLAGTVLDYVVFAGAIAGFVLLVARRTRVAPLVAPILGVLVSAIVAYGSTRFRLAAAPVLIVTASVAGVALYDRVSAHRVEAIVPS